MPDSCMRCGRCCTSFGVCVTPSDIRRISRATGLPPFSFIQAIPEPPGREREEPSVLIGGKPSLIVLKWPKARRCIFYGGAAGCLIYQNRPLLCRTYPFRSCGGKLKEMKSRACPYRWKPSDKKEYMPALRAYEKTLASYRRFARNWNWHGGTLEEFLAKCLGKPQKQATFCIRI